MNRIYPLLISLFAVAGLFAQDKARENGFIFDYEDSDNFQYDSRRDVTKPMMPVYDVEEQPFHQGKKKSKQQDAYLNKDYFFPAKPRNAWRIGIRGGAAMVNGDVSQNFFGGAEPFAPGYTFGGFVQKAFTYNFSMRAKYSYMEMWNTDGELSTLSIPVQDRSPAFANYAPGDRVAYNSTTIAHDVIVDAMFSIGNQRYHRERSNVLFNVFGGGGLMFYQTFTDQLDDDGNPYDYGSIDNTQDASDILSDLNDLRNGVYESPANTDDRNSTFEVGNYSAVPVLNVGAGLTFRLSRVLDLDIEGRMVFTRDDLIDGVQFAEPTAASNTLNADLTNNFDTYATTEIGLSFKIVTKKATEPLTHLNPNAYAYQKMMQSDPEVIEEQLSEDSDEDGVPDFLDQEEDSECDKVDAKGRVLDSDGDGVNDCNDEEPYSQPGYPVDENGVADVKTCCDELDPEMFESGSDLDCEDLDKLPSIIFEGDKISVSADNLASLHLIAEKMQACPELNVVATGATDQYSNKKYNEQISWNRAQSVVDYMTSEYGIDRNRFVIEYTSEAGENPVSDRRVDMRAATGDESGESNPAAPHPGINVGSE